MPFPCINWAAALGIPKNSGAALSLTGNKYLFGSGLRASGLQPSGLQAR
jgi:hypothetical protein